MNEHTTKWRFLNCECSNRFALFTDSRAKLLEITFMVVTLVVTGLYTNRVQDIFGGAPTRHL